MLSVKPPRDTTKKAADEKQTLGTSAIKLDSMVAKQEEGKRTLQLSSRKSLSRPGSAHGSERDFKIRTESALEEKNTMIEARR